MGLVAMTMAPVGEVPNDGGGKAAVLSGCRDTPLGPVRLTFPDSMVPQHGEAMAANATSGEAARGIIPHLRWRELL